MAGFGDMGDSNEESDSSDTSSFDELMSQTRKASKDLNQKNLNVGIYGKPKTGKTHFSMSAPGPILYIDTESGTGPVEHKFADEKDIQILDLNEIGDDYEQDHVIAWRKFNEAVNYIVENEDEFETVVVDSASDIWSICQDFCKVEIFGLAPEDRLNQQWDWGDINARYRNTVQKLLKADFNVIMTSRAQEQYNGAGNPSGEYDPKWQNKTAHWLNLVIYNQKEWSDDDMKKITSTIEDSRFDSEEKGETLMGKQIVRMEWDDLVEVMGETLDMTDGEE